MYSSHVILSLVINYYYYYFFFLFVVDLLGYMTRVRHSQRNVQRKKKEEFIVVLNFKHDFKIDYML